MPTPVIAPREEAEAELQSRGFEALDGHWQGSLDVLSESYSVRVAIPVDFPSTLPEIFFDRAQLKRQIAHIEKSGKACIAPVTGFTLDTTNPPGIIAECLVRAAQIILDGVTGKSAPDLVTEFLAYWNSGAEHLLSICNQEGPARPIALAGLRYSGTIPFNRKMLLADSVAEAQQWIQNLHSSLTETAEAFYIPLESSFTPPDFDVAITVSQALRWVRDHGSATSRNSFDSWLKTTLLPTIILFSFPLADGSDRVLAGLRIEKLSIQAKKKAQNACRPTNYSASIELLFSGPAPCTKLAPDRFDEEFLLPRGGANLELAGKIVAVIGCGAVGSYTVQNLAAAGVAKFRLVDHDDLAPANLHRHVLGAKYVGKNKASALAEFFLEHYPHHKYEVRKIRALEVMAAEPEFLLDADLIVVAAGDETLALTINKQLSSKQIQYVWLDPMGLGGHVLTTSETRGCFECLFKRHEQFGLYNAASFAAPGQAFHKSFAGCAGVFTPFGAADASRIAGVAARQSVSALLGKLVRSALVSWCGDRAEFEAEGFRVSSRVDLFQPNVENVEEAFFAEDCSICRTKPQ